MNDDENTLIASRRYYIAPEGQGDQVVVSIAKPFRDEGGYFRCGYVFSGSTKIERYASGVDELHAILMALAMAGTDLEQLNVDKYGSKLVWEAGPAKSSLPTIRDHWPFRQGENNSEF